MNKRNVFGKVIKIALPVLVLIGVGFGIYKFVFSQSDTEESETKTVKVTKGEIKPTLAVTGTVVSENETGVNFETSGELTEVNAKVGDVVAVGQQLAKIDDTDLQRQVTIQKANYNSAVAKYNQAKASPQSDSYEIQIQAASVTQAKQNYQEALDNLEKATLTSPIAGTVLAVNASVGEQAGGTSSTGSSDQSSSSTSSSQTSSSSTSSSSSSSGDFVVIADLTKLQIEASVDQVDIPKIAKDQTVAITFDAISDKEFKGKVVNIDPTASTSQDVVTYNIVTSIENPDPKIQLGMTADIEIDLGRKENVLVVPNLAVKTKDDKKVVSKMINGTATSVNVEVGLSDDDYTEITSGLSEGDQVVVDVFSSSGQTTESTGQTNQNQSNRETRMPGVPGF